MNTGRTGGESGRTETGGFDGDKSRKSGDAKPARREPPDAAPAPEGKPAPAEDAAGGDGFRINLASLTEADVRELLEKAKSADEYLDKLRYSMAELQNFRKRIEKEKEDWRKYGALNVMTGLLPVIDNMEKAIEVSQSSGEGGCIVEGLLLIHSMMMAVLSGFGLKTIEVLGMPFDPCRHESVGFAEVEGAQPNTVAKVVLKGYMMHDRLIRAAKVLIAGAPTASPGTECRTGEPAEGESGSPTGKQKGKQ